MTLNWLKNHAAKIFAGLTTAQTILQLVGSNPLVALAGPQVAAISTAATGIITVLLTLFAPGKGLNSIPSSTTTAKLLCAALFLPLLMALSGCAALSALVNSPSAQQTLIKDGVELAASGILQAEPAANRTAIAKDVVTGCTALVAAVGSSNLPANTAQATLAQALSSTKLTAAQQAELNEFIGTLNGVVTSLQSSNQIVGTEALTAGNICSWFIVAASPFAS